MADEKIYTSDSPMTSAMLGSMLGNNMGNNDVAALAAMNGGMGGAWNNPFIYLVWMMFANRYMGNDNNPSLQSQMSALQGVVQDNHNSDLLMSAVNGSTEATRALATAMNANFDNVSSAICSVRNSITEANGNIQLAAEKMIANNNMQSALLGSQMSDQCCGIKTAIVEQGYQNQLNNCGQTNTILMQSQNIQNAIQRGFADTGFLMERNTNTVREASQLNTQRIIDTLNSHWNLEQQTTIQQLRDEVSRLNQTNTLIAALKSSSTTTA